MLNDLQQICTYFKANKLSLTISKLIYSLFNCQDKNFETHQHFTPLNIKHNLVKRQKTSSFELLLTKYSHKNHIQMHLPCSIFRSCDYMNKNYGYMKIWLY